MARLARIAVGGLPHLLVQRGAAGAEVFRDAQDYEAFRAQLLEHTRALHLAMHAYVLMPDQLHLLVTPAEAPALARLMQAIGRRYVRDHNRRHGRFGTLWQGRFRSCIVDPEGHLLLSMRYVETLPVRVGMVATPEDYPWSSYRHHAGFGVDPLITDHTVFWALGNTPFERQAVYRRLAAEQIPAPDVERLGDAGRRGRAIGSPAFLQSLGTRLGIDVSARKRGRPRKPSV
jgi:putative transposase